LKKILPIVLVIAVGVGAFLFFQKGSGGGINLGSNDNFSGSLLAATKLGVPMKCTYKVEGNEYVGYVKGENWRGSMKSAQGKTSEVIMKDNCMWTWEEGVPQGMTTCFEPVEGEEETDLWEGAESAATSPDVNYSCIPTVITGSTFTPPVDVEFLDLDQMMQGFGQ